MSTLTSASQLCQIPEDCIPEFGVTIVSYVDEDGTQMYAYATHGDGDRASLVGLLEMVGHDIMHDEDL
jgi:hypothetical protein